jgi:hypothetical protein
MRNAYRDAADEPELAMRAVRSDGVPALNRVRLYMSLASRSAAGAGAVSMSDHKLIQGGLPTPWPCGCRIWGDGEYAPCDVHRETSKAQFLRGYGRTPLTR